MCVAGSDGSVWEVAVGVKRNDTKTEEGEWPQVEVEDSYAVDLTGTWVQTQFGVTFGRARWLVQIQAVQVQVAPQWIGEEETCGEYTPYVPDIVEQAWLDGLGLGDDEEEATPPREGPVAKVMQQQHTALAFDSVSGEVGEVEKEVDETDDS